jgi:hypothetical protein
MKNIMKEAHNLTKKIIRKGDSYKATFRICLSYVHSQVKKGVNKMVELKGSEKQVKWALEIRKQVLEVIENARTRKVEEVSKRADKVKKDGTVITAKDRVEKMNKRFNELTKSIENNESSAFFIENFSSITSRSAVSKKFVVKSYLEKIENKMESYF